MIPMLALAMTSTRILFVSFIVLSGCVAANKKNDRSFAEKLSGDSYESANSVNTIPVLNKEAPVKRKISGRVFCGEGLQRIPANNAQVSFFDQGKSIVQGS